MKYQATAIRFSKSNSLLKRLNIALTVISTIGMGLWAWIQNNPNHLPAPDSSYGKSLLRQYQGLTYDIWLILLLLAVGYLINRSYINQQREEAQSTRKAKGPTRSFLQFIRKNPVTTILFISYTVAMIAGTTYLYKDMVGWYPDLIDGYLLDNFSLRNSLINETMRRTDYRFFPLAHQDIHILSWFSIQIKTWMLFSAAELIGIVLLCVKFINRLEKQQKSSTAVVLFVSTLLLIHPSTGTTFFHVIYCERMLCLVFMLYINAYLEYINTRRSSSFYITLLWALIGIYIKDIAIILFAIPPASLWLADAIKKKQKPDNQKPTSPGFNDEHQLERWLCSLPLVFICSYISLALIPSSFAAEGAYNSDASFYIFLDFRFYLFALIAMARAIAISQKKIEFNLLDSINLSAFAYALTLLIVYKFDSSSYLAFPFQLIASINITWAWVKLIQNNRHHISGGKKAFLSAFLPASIILALDYSTSSKTFYHEIAQQKFEQNYIQSAYENLDQISRLIREQGSDVNVIINRRSRLSAYRHLNRIPYSALIEYNPKNKTYKVVDGKRKGENYLPKTGDLIANLDKRIDLIQPILKGLKTELLYRHNPTEQTGLILRITGFEPSDSREKLINNKAAKPTAI